MTENESIELQASQAIAEQAADEAFTRRKFEICGFDEATRLDETTHLQELNESDL